MHEHGETVVGDDDESVREHLQEGAVDRSDRVDDLVGRIDRDPGTHDALREELVGHGGQGSDGSHERGLDVGHGYSSVRRRVSGPHHRSRLGWRGTPFLRMIRPLARTGTYQ